MAAVRDIGPGGHHLGHPHTLENFQRAFFMPKLFDNNSVEQWAADGSKDTTARALEQARSLLEGYEQSALDVAMNEALREHIARRDARDRPRTIPTCCIEPARFRAIKRQYWFT